ncbi:MAG: hypothetical protein V4630_18635, partial [Pseudomonadota bacterium]
PGPTYCGVPSTPAILTCSVAAWAVVRDELLSGTLVEASRLDGIGETFFAVTRTRRFPNPLLVEVLPG